MKHTGSFELWTHPNGGMSPAFHHISYVLFRTDDECAKIVGARCPDMKQFSVGTSLFDSLDLGEDARRYLFTDHRGGVPLFIWTNKGVGVLSKRYDRQVGIGLYLHIHGRPDALARLLNYGVLGDSRGGLFDICDRIKSAEGGVTQGDVPSYEALTDAWSAMTAFLQEGFPSPVHDCIPRCQLESTILHLGEFVGCGVNLADGNRLLTPVDRLKCYRPVLLEALLLILLTEVRTYSATREATVQLSSLDGREEGNLSMTMRYPLEESVLSDEFLPCLEQIHRYLAWVCELGGLELHAEIIKPRRHERVAGKLSELQLTLAWLTNPAVLSTSDLKAKIQFRYREEAEKQS